MNPQQNSFEVDQHSEDVSLTCFLGFVPLCSVTTQRGHHGVDE